MTELEVKKEVLKKVLVLIDDATSHGRYVHITELADLFPDVFEQDTQTVRSREYNDYIDEYEETEHTFHRVRIKGSTRWYGGV